MRTKLSIRGLYQYRQDLFDGLTLPSGMDKQRLISMLITRLAPLSLVWTDPDILKQMITDWSVAQLHGWERIWQTLHEDYDPLHNYDRREEWEDTGNSSGKTEVAGFNQSSGFADQDRVTSSLSSKRKGRAYGNIGVTTSAQMAEGEIGLRTAYNTYDLIVDDFKQRFCLLIY